jgi:hypothetical protein
MSGLITLYENGLERNIDSLSGEEITMLTEAINELLDGDYTVDLYSGYVFGVDDYFFEQFCVPGELFPLDNCDGWQVEFTSDENSVSAVSSDSD